jgi:hypothetical protein
MKIGFGRQRMATRGGTPSRPAPARTKTWPDDARPRVKRERETDVASVLSILLTVADAGDSDPDSDDPDLDP